MFKLLKRLRRKKEISVFLGNSVYVYREAAGYGTHGRMVVTDKSQELQEVEVPFVFVGMAEPPVLTPNMLSLLFVTFEAKGYFPHYLSAYGQQNEKLLADQAEAGTAFPILAVNPEIRRQAIPTR